MGNLSNQAQAAEKLQMQKTASMLYKEVKAYLEQNSVEDLTEKFKELHQKLVADNNYNVTIDEYSMLGFVTYLVGIDMTSSRDVVLKNVAENYRSRFIDNKLNNIVFINILVDVLKVIETKNFEGAKNELKEILQKVIPGDKNELGKMRIAIRNSLKHYAIPVAIAKDLSELVSREKLTYNDVLRYNHVMQIESVFLDGSMKATINILTNQKFVESLQIGEKLYTQQKFSLVHFDSIISVKELLERIPNCLMFATVPYTEENLSDEKLSEYGIVSQTSQKAATVQEDKNAESKHEIVDTEPKRLPEEEPDFFVRACAEEYLKHKIENVDDFNKAIDMIIDSGSDFLQYFYQYIAYQKNNKENRKKFEEVWSEFTKDELRDSINSVIGKLQSEGKEIAEHLFAEIPEKNRGHIANYVHECIDNLIIVTDENNSTKSYLLSQFSENGIITYHHLQQIMALIESQYICGAGFTSYCNLYDYISTQTDAKEIFEESEILETNNMKINVYMQLKSFYFADEDSKNNKESEAENN